MKAFTSPMLLSGIGLQVRLLSMPWSVMTMCSSPETCLPSHRPYIQRMSSFGRSSASGLRMQTSVPNGSTGRWYER
eukprot:479043-Heterocapsa_arctica.AAC.1